MKLIETDNLERIMLELKFQREDLIKAHKLYKMVCTWQGRGFCLKPQGGRIALTVFSPLQATNLEPLPSLEDLDNTVFGAERKKRLSIIGKKAGV